MELNESTVNMHVTVTNLKSLDNICSYFSLSLIVLGLFGHRQGLA
jgi:hypothetical protein